jgi:MFS transporter, DHA2 family, multidrug resistance protein
VSAASGVLGAAGRPAWTVVIGVMLTAVLEVLDTSVVNVALPHMMGSFGATPDQITWLITSYLISTAIVMPLTGYLVTRFGRRTVVFTGVIGFVLASIACGLSWSLASMVLFRFLQGGFGAVLVPISQSIVIDAFPREKRNQAMAIWGLAIMVAPVMGPVVGGAITEHWDWRWVFFINVPIGVFALVLLLDEVGGAAPQPEVRTDWTGLALLSLALGAFQTMLDQGHTRDWFDSGFIWILSWVAGTAFVLFIVRALSREHNIVDIRLFADRNFLVGSLLMGGYSLAMYSTIVMWPLLAQDVLGYPADTAGWVLAPRGAVSAVMMIVIGSWIAPLIDHRWLIGGGMLLSVLACSMMAQLSLAVDTFGLIAPGLVFGLAMACVFSQVSSAAFETTPAHKGAEAAGLFNVMRTIGGSIGIAITSTLLVRREQVHWHHLGTHLSDTNPRLYDWLDHTNVAIDDVNAPVKLAQELFRHVQMNAFNDVFWFIAAVFACLSPLALFLRHTHKHYVAA